MLGPYIKSMGTTGTKMQTSSQWRHMYNKGKQFENQFWPKPKVKLGKVQVGSNIAQNHSSSP